MKSERRLLVLTFLFHAMVFADVVFRKETDVFTGPRLVLALLIFLAAYGAACFYPKAQGRILLMILLFLNVTPVFIVGTLVGKKGSDRVRLIASTVLGLIPAVLLGVSLLSHWQGNTPTEWTPQWNMVGGAIYGGLFWFFATQWIACISSVPKERSP